MLRYQQIRTVLVCRNALQCCVSAGLDGQYGLGRRTPGGMSMSTGDLAALYEAQLNGSSADLLAAASSGNLQALNSMSTGNLRSLASSNALPQSQVSTRVAAFAWLHHACL